MMEEDRFMNEHMIMIERLRKKVLWCYIIEMYLKEHHYAG